MWRPKPHRRWSLPILNAPSATEAQSSRLFSSVALGPIELESRTWVPAMVPWRATESGEVTEALLRWYERFARGRPGAIVVEATGIRDIPSGPLLRIGHPRFESGLRELTRRVRAASAGHTRVLIQLIDFLPIRRRPDADRYFERYLNIRSAHREWLANRGHPDAESLSEPTIRKLLSELDPSAWCEVLDDREWEALSRGYRERVDDLHLESIRRLPQELPELFAQAAQRANAVGFDGIELHYAHAYTMASFLSRTNRRSDGFGDSLEGRLRLPIDVLTQCKSGVADNFVVGLRMLSEECIDGGTSLAESCTIARALAAAGADFISLSRGGKFEDALNPRVGEAIYPYTGPSGYECMPTVYSDERGPFGRNLHATSTVRAFLRKTGLATPVVAAGGFCSYTQMEEALTTNAADIIAAARQSMADPDWWLKLRNGHGQAIRRCEYTNYCEALDQRHKIVTCKLWDRSELPENGPDLSPDGRRRLIAPSDYDPATFGEKAT